MIQLPPRYVAAAVQATPVFLDCEATIAKTCRLISEAAAVGAHLVVFPAYSLPVTSGWAPANEWRPQSARVQQQ